jgi:hypothetical protein
MRAVKIEVVSAQFVNDPRTVRDGELFQLRLLRRRNFAAYSQCVYFEILENCREATDVVLVNVR